MKLTKRQLKSLINEESQKLDEIPTYLKNRQRASGESLNSRYGSGPRRYNSMSDRSKAIARSVKRAFNKDYPDVNVGIDTREGWVTVNGKKAVNMSSASGKHMSTDDIIDQMKQAYLGHPVSEATRSKPWAFQARQPHIAGRMRDTSGRVVSRPWQGGPDEVMRTTSLDVTWSDGTPRGKLSRRGTIDTASMPAAILVKDSDESYSLTKKTPTGASPEIAEFVGKDSAGQEVIIRVTTRGSNMVENITKRQLKRIIKEEKRKLLKEYYPIGGDLPTPIWEAFKAAAWEAAAEKIEAGMEAKSIMAAMQDDIKVMIIDMESDWDDADQDPASQQHSEGTSLDQMSSSWRQVLGSCLKGKK